MPRLFNSHVLSILQCRSSFNEHRPDGVTTETPALSAGSPGFRSRPSHAGDFKVDIIVAILKVTCYCEVSTRTS